MMMSATTIINRGGTVRRRRRKESSTCSTSSSSMKSTMRSRVTTTTTTTTNAMCTGRRSSSSSSLRIASVRNRDDVDERAALAVSTGRRASASGGARARTTRARASGGNDDREREIEEATKKWGLEVGLWKVFKSKSTGENNGGGGGENNADFSRMDMAKKLLKRYGSAYLLTSISLSLISITVFYFAVSSGIDVASLLEKVGINVNATSEQFGTFALAYAAHKASSPIRFGPTVALTPLVAKWLGKEIAVEDEMDG